VSDVWAGQLPLLADTSAWTKVRRAPTQTQALWARAIRNRYVYVCPVVRLELLHHESTAETVNRRDHELDQMPQLDLTQEIADLAINAMLELATRSEGYHRVRAPDALIAATAALVGPEPLAVLHQDGHFVRLAEVLDFTPYSLVPAGTQI
jgi:predicted nucleic acid-binding protein